MWVKLITSCTTFHKGALERESSDLARHAQDVGRDRPRPDHRKAQRRRDRGDLHRDLRLGSSPLRSPGPFYDAWGHRWPRADGARRRDRVRNRPQGRRPGRRSVPDRLRQLLLLQQGLQTQCETTQNTDMGTGPLPVGYSQLYGAIPGGQAQFLRVPHAAMGPSRSATSFPTTATSSCRMCCPPRGRQFSTPGLRRATASRCSASDRSVSSARASHGTWA